MRARGEISRLFRNDELIRFRRNRLSAPVSRIIQIHGWLVLNE